MRCKEVKSGEVNSGAVRSATEEGGRHAFRERCPPGASGALGLDGVDGGRVGHHLNQGGAVAGGQDLQEYNEKSAGQTCVRKSCELRQGMEGLEGKARQGWLVAGV